MAKLTHKINKEWHQQNRMPEKATLAQRIEWHIAHAKHCSCRDMPDKISQEIKKRMGSTGNKR